MEAWKRATMIGLVLLLAAAAGLFTLRVLAAPEPSVVQPIALDADDGLTEQPSEVPAGGIGGHDGGAIPAPLAPPAPAGDDDDDNDDDDDHDDGTRSGSDNTDPA